jgi:phosphomevalonate kinase
MFCISAPGKQMIAGEWAVLELGNPCLVAAINNRVRAKIEESREAEILIEDFNLKVLADLKKRRLIFKNKLNKEEKNKLIFIKKAIETSLQYLEVEKPFKIKTWSETFQIEVNGEKKKVGFGSSAASVVATVGGLLKFDGKDIKKEETKDIIFKLSVISHYFAQGKLGSGFDIAASTYGGVILYKRFDDKWLTSEIKKGKRIKEIVEKKWKERFYID